MKSIICAIFTYFLLGSSEMGFLIRKKFLEDLFEAEDQSEIEVEIERERRVENSFGILTKV